LRQSLRNFTTPERTTRGLSLSELTTSEETKADTPDNHAFIRSLYQALSTYCLCKCSQDLGYMTANLRLNWSCKEKYDEEDAVSFSLLFLDHHVPGASDNTYRWQDTQISVFQRRLGSIQSYTTNSAHMPPRTISFEDHQELTTLREDKDEDCTYQFCKLITRGDQAQLKFVAFDGGLEFQGSLQSPREFLTDSPSISLAELIRSRHLTRKMKALLSFFLARSVWQFYNSDWMKDGWTKEKVRFMFEHHPSCSSVIFINEPFLLARLEKAEVDKPILKPKSKGDMSSDKFIAHKYPKILALGVMLLEIELGRPIEEFRRSDSRDSDGINAIHPAACSVLKDERVWPQEEAFTPIKEVIEICVKPDTGQLGTNQKEVRHKLHQHVVATLENFLQISWAHPDKEKVAPITPEATRTTVKPSTGLLHDSTLSVAPLVNTNTPPYQSPRKPWHSSFGTINQYFDLPPFTGDPRQPRTSKDFKIAIICALPLEANAIKAVFDVEWDCKGDVYGKATTDRNSYITGMIGRHNIVLAFMPEMGKGSAAVVAANLHSSFESIKLALVVGICGGVPTRRTTKEEIVLGDVIISEGIVAHDRGKQLHDRLEPSQLLKRPQSEIAAFLHMLKTKDLHGQTAGHLADLRRKGWEKASYLGAAKDMLFIPEYRHKHQDASGCKECAQCKEKTDPVCEKALESSCEELGCNPQQLVRRDRLSEHREVVPLNPHAGHTSSPTDPAIHFGPIASGDAVIKSAVARDKATEALKVIGFEMEGAGVLEAFPTSTLVIKAVCDYADSHKNKEWQDYAAASAAACVKAVLAHWAVPREGLLNVDPFPRFM
jgi:nucleoside phosphorylase